jgi:hypothetical protein
MIRMLGRGAFPNDFTGQSQYPATALIAGCARVDTLSSIVSQLNTKSNFWVLTVISFFKPADLMYNAA